MFFTLNFDNNLLKFLNISYGFYIKALKTRDAHL